MTLIASDAGRLYGDPVANNQILQALDHMPLNRKRNSVVTSRMPAFAVLPLIFLGGCASLPSSGPTGPELQRSAAAQSDLGPIKVVEVANVAALPVEVPAPPKFENNFEPAPTDLVGPGDVLSTAIYETGSTLFAGDTRSPTETSGFASAAQVERLPSQRVDDNGEIRLPYIGKLHVAGLTIPQIEAMIRNAMRGLSQNPQAVVAIQDDITNSIILNGEIGRPGRLVLPTNRETIGDTIALSGGYRGEAKDLSVVLERQSTRAEFRLDSVLNGAQRDLMVRPGDRISVLRAPRTFTVLGAPGRVEQIPFSAPSLSLTEAVAAAGGSNPNAGDPRAIFVFRFEQAQNGVSVPTVYHVNMMEAGAYFLTQKFAMRDKDILYIGNAGANQPSKLVAIISQLFAPIVTATSAVAVLKN